MFDGLYSDRSLQNGNAPAIRARQATPARLGIEAAIVGTSATTLNLSQILCPNEMCGTDSNIIWTVDGTHLSTTTSRFLTPDLIKALR